MLLRYSYDVLEMFLRWSRWPYDREMHHIYALDNNKSGVLDLDYIHREFKQYIKRPQVRQFPLCVAKRKSRLSATRLSSFLIRLRFVTFEYRFNHFLG